jgi:hypothetical protein
MSERVFVSDTTQKLSFSCCYGDRARLEAPEGRALLAKQSSSNRTTERQMTGCPIGGSMSIAGAVAELNKEIERLTLIRDSLLQASSSVQARAEIIDRSMNRTVGLDELHFHTAVGVL